MSNELEIICSELIKNLKDEKSIEQTIQNVDQLSYLINKSSPTKLTFNLQFLIPTILQIIDHFEFKVKGVQLIDQLVLKLDHQNFRKQGFDNLILFTLKNQFYQQDLELFKYLFTICEHALIKFNFQAVNSTKPVTELDEIVDIILNLIEIGTDEEIRLICLEQLPKFLKILNKAVYKHLNRLIDDFVFIVDPNFLTARPKQIRAFLIILDELINSTSERFDISKPLIVLIKLLFCINEIKDQDNEIDKTELHSIHNQTLNCLKSINKSNPNKLKMYTNELEQNQELRILYDQIENDLRTFIIN